MGYACRETGFENLARLRRREGGTRVRLTPGCCCEFMGEEEGGEDLGVERNEESDDSDDDDIVIQGSPAVTPKKGKSFASQAAGSK